VPRANRRAVFGPISASVAPVKDALGCTAGEAVVAFLQFCGSRAEAPCQRCRVRPGGGKESPGRARTTFP